MKLNYNSDITSHLVFIFYNGLWLIQSVVYQGTANFELKAVEDSN